MSRFYGLQSQCGFIVVNDYMRIKIIILMFMVGLLEIVRAASNVPTVPTCEEAYQTAMEMLTYGVKSDVPDKRVGPVRILLTSGSKDEQKVATQAVAEINDAFGYGKLALSNEEKARREDNAISIYIGSKSKGRQLVEDFGVSSPRAFRGSVYYYWWEEHKPHHIWSGIIAIDDKISPHVMAVDLRRLVLASLGYPGVKVAAQTKAGTAADSEIFPKFLSEIDVALLRFCEKHIPPAAKAWEIRKVFEREWPDFSTAFWNPSGKVSGIN